MQAPVVFQVKEFSLSLHYKEVGEKKNFLQIFLFGNFLAFLCKLKFIKIF